jgi:Vault protein inter-alpha-trypsin domain/von Willebrand factor type A domain
MRGIAVLLCALMLAPSAPTESDGPAAGVGRLDADAADGSSHPLELRSLAVDATVRGDAAETRVEHVFWNPTEETLQGTFRFPLPDDAVLVGLAMEVEGKMVDGELVEREKAQRIYERIVDDMRDPALLEWDGGSVFKLRVFPIEPMSEKRVVIRYVSPLRRDARKGWQYVYPLGARTDLGAFRLTLDGELRWDATSFPAPSQIALDLPRERWPGDVQREETDDATYTAVRVRPDWTLVPPPPDSVRTRRHVLVLLDDSRSALESRPLALQALQVVLDSLDGRDRFRVSAFDITVRDQVDAFVPYTRQAAAEAMDFARSLEPDGASDLSLALRHAGRIAGALSAADRDGLEVVYVGDGSPTWGETGRDALVALATQELPGVVFHSVAIGRAADSALLRALSGATGGRFEQPRRLQDVTRLAATLPNARRQRLLRDARIVAPEGHTVLPDGARTLFEDDDWQVLVRSPKGAPPDSLVLEGRTALGPYRQAIALGAPTAGGFMPPRFGTLAVAALEGSASSRDDVVRASLQYGVMSRHTAFLVLESEEAYARFQVRRREAQEARVSGGDLESTDGEASLSPDRIQPGDPEVRIPAPADARAVTVTFPFGETKVARYEPALGAWTVRFLIDQDTPDGMYQVYVRITHASGRVELLRLAYTVDTEAPAVAVTWRWAAGRSRTYLIEARQVATEVPLSPVTGATDASLTATIVEDARRVDVRLPDGEVLSLGLTRPGLFRGYWRPRRPLTAPVTLTVVATDRALNSRTAQVTLDPQPAATASR